MPTWCTGLLSSTAWLMLYLTSNHRSVQFLYFASSGAFQCCHLYEMCCYVLLWIAFFMTSLLRAYSRHAQSFFSEDAVQFRRQSFSLSRMTERVKSLGEPWNNNNNNVSLLNSLRKQTCNNLHGNKKNMGKSILITIKKTSINKNCFKTICLDPR